MTEIRARLGVFATATVASVAGVGFLLAGCGSSAGTHAGANGTSSALSSTSGMSMSVGMSMGSGGSMAPSETGAPSAAASTTSPPNTAPATTTAAATKPSKTSLMVCGDDIKGKVRSVMKLAKPAPTTSTFKDDLYTCTYTLPQGKMVLSVKKSGTDAAAGKYFNAVRTTLPATHSLLGLGEHAYATNTGIAVVIKDDQTLRVDATGMPAVFGSEQQKRTDLAYEIASDVLECWTGDGDE